MTGIWLISYIGLWVVAVLLLIAIATLARLVGMLYLRVGPSGARFVPTGPGIGETVSRREYPDLDGKIRIFGGRAMHPALLLFVSPNCPACDTVARAVGVLTRTEKNLTILTLAVHSDEDSNRVAAKRWGNLVPLIQLPPAGVIEFQVQTTPFALVLDREGVVRAKGIVNQVEQLHSLLNALDSGYATTGQFDEAHLTQEERLRRNKQAMPFGPS